MTSGRPSGLNWRHFFRTNIVPSPVLALLLLAILLLFLAVFVFGQAGRYTNPNLEDILRTMSIGAIAALVTTIVDRHVISRDLDDRIHASLLEAEGVAKSISDLGVNRAHATLDFGAIFREAKQGETVSWLDTYCPTKDSFLGDIQDAVKRGVLVRMLIIDPESPNAHFRSEELWRSFQRGAAWEAALREFSTKMDLVQDSLNELDALGRNMEIRQYGDLPCVPMYLISGGGGVPRKGYFSIFLTKPTAFVQHIELEAGPWLNDMLDYYDDKWNRQAPRVPRPGPASDNGPSDKAPMASDIQRT